MLRWSSTEAENRSRLDDITLGEQESCLTVMGEGWKARTVTFGEQTHQVLEEYIKDERPESTSPYLLVSQENLPWSIRKQRKAKAAKRRVPDIVISEVAPKSSEDKPDVHALGCLFLTWHTCQPDAWLSTSKAVEVLLVVLPEECSRRKGNTPKRSCIV